MRPRLAEKSGIHAVREAAATWMQVCRVKSLAISSIGVIVGAAVAFDERAYHPLRLLAWAGSVAIQAGTNLTNVSYNYKGGSGPFRADPKGSSAVVLEGLLRAEEVRRGGWCVSVGVLRVGFC